MKPRLQNRSGHPGEQPLEPARAPRGGGPGRSGRAQERPGEVEKCRKEPGDNGADRQALQRHSCPIHAHVTGATRASQTGNGLAKL